MRLTKQAHKPVATPQADFPHKILQCSVYYWIIHNYVIRRVVKTLLLPATGAKVDPFCLMRKHIGLPRFKSKSIVLRLRGYIVIVE